ncbi:MAG: TonB-dependent receptor plug domain-containing protein [Pseudomonadales bacterium]|nr:TonB-dependent receptor plug domain-containing protein [Pseudomonadales bacterium]
MLPVAVFGQDEITGTDSTVTYPASYFSQYSPVSVNDMLERIPGIDLALGGATSELESRFRGGNRGLGGSSQILIDGKRLAGKANEARSQLDRIAAEDVEYIELVRGTSSDLDVQNSGQLINIVLLESASGSSYGVELGMRHFQDGSVKPEATLSLTGQSGSFNYLVSADMAPGYRVEESLELSMHSDLNFNEIIELEREIDQTNYRFNSNLSWDFNNGDRIALNLLYGETDPPSKLLREITDYNGASPIVTYERERVPAEAYNWEIGGDYERNFANGGKYKLLFIVNDRVGDTTRERFDIANLGDIENKNLFLDSNSSYQEKIVRTSYTWNVAADQGIEVGVEGAQTTQDSALLLGLPLGGEHSEQHGGLTAVDLPNAISTVEEIRYEGFAVHNWRINPRMSLESSLVAEYSEIEQSGDIYNKRDFDFLKPKFDFRYDLNNSSQFRFTLEKFVAQLSFADFSANTNERDEDQDTIAGNPELVQQQSWRYTAYFDYRLPNDGGVVNTRLFYYDFEDDIGRIDISPSPTQLESTNGNVGDGRVVGLDVNASVRLSMLNLPQALVTAGLLVQDSKIFDPLINDDRKVVPYDRGGFNLGYRHDVSSLGLNYGFNYQDRFDGNRAFWDIYNIYYIGSRSNLMLFAEKTGWLGLTYRLEAINVLDHEQKNERRRYVGYFRDDVLDEIERFYVTDGVRYTFKIRGTF